MPMAKRQCLGSVQHVLTRAQKRKTIGQETPQLAVITEQVQAFEMSYTLVQTAVAEWLRSWNVLPSQCFEDYGLNSFRSAARRFFHGEGSAPVDRHPIAIGEASFSKIVPGVSKPSDTVLDWLVLFDDPLYPPQSIDGSKDIGMRNHRGGHLEGLIIDIILDKTRPDQIHDRFILSFDEEIRSFDRTGHPTVAAIQEGIPLLLQDIQIPGKTFKDLPDQRWLKCSFFNRPAATCPTYLTRHEKPELFVAQFAGGIIDCGMLSTGFNRSVTLQPHKSSIRAEKSSIKIQVGANASNLESSVVPSVLPSQIVNGDLRFPESQLHASAPTTAHTQRSSNPRAVSVQHFDPAQQSPGAISGVTSSSMVTRPFLKMVLVSECELDVIAKDKIRQRLRREPWPAQNQQVVKCECGCGTDKESTGKELKQVQCALCSYFQHEICYGFREVRPSARHYCYQCLLEGEDDRLLQKLVNLAIYRRAMWLVDDQGLPANTRTFKKYLKLNSQRATNMLIQMREDGFLNESFDPENEANPTLVRDTRLRQFDLWEPIEHLQRYYVYETLTPTSTTMQQQGLDRSNKRPRRV